MLTSMGARGTLPKTTLKVVRDGNPGHRSNEDIDSPGRKPFEDKSIAFKEPKWPSDVTSRARHLWRTLYPVLEREIGMVGAQQESLVQFCIVQARVELLDHVIARDGFQILNGRGDPMRNPDLISQSALHAQLSKLRAELGLSPGAALRLEVKKGGYAATQDEADAFD